jgi:hypothetical protein
LYVFTNGTIDKENTINCIQNDILKNGPAVTCFQLYEDFNYYWNNIAKISSSIYIYGNYTANVDASKNIQYGGGHSVVITGWGTGVALVNNIPTTVRYWEIRNNWGNTGDNGYGKIAFSTDAPTNEVVQLDIPSQVNSNNYSGGVFTFQPGVLPPDALTILNENSSSSPTANNYTNPTDIFYYIFIGLIVCTVILLVLYYYNNTI